MALPYLETSDYDTYGLTASPATDLQVLEATYLINGYVRRDLAVQTYTKNLEMSDGGYTVLPYAPIVSLIEARGRFLPVSNHDYRKIQSRYMSDELYWLTSNFITISGIPKWSDLDVTLCDLNPRTGMFYVPASIYGMRWSEVEVTYEAGFTLIPDDVKMATARIAKQLPSRISGNVQRMKQGDLEMSFFSESYIPDEVRQVLSPYRKWALA